MGTIRAHPIATIDLSERLHAMRTLLLTGLLAVMALTVSSCGRTSMSRPSGVDGTAAQRPGVVVPGGYIEFEDHPRSRLWYW
jgi:hypothetical protein